MNGIIKIKVAKKDYILRFSYLACQDFEKRIFKHPSSNNVKLLTDLVYSGIYGEAVRNDEVMPLYSAAYDIIEDMSAQKDFKDLSDAIFECYNKSKYGSEFVKRIEEYSQKKKT